MLGWRHNIHCCMFNSVQYITTDVGTRVLHADRQTDRQTHSKPEHGGSDTSLSPVSQWGLPGRLNRESWQEEEREEDHWIPASKWEGRANPSIQEGEVKTDARNVQMPHKMAFTEIRTTYFHCALPTVWLLHSTHNTIQPNTCIERTYSAVVR